MSEASENLKRMMAAHPEIKKLAEQKVAMRQALIDKGFREELYEEKLKDFTCYADMISALEFSIDTIINENGYNHDFGGGLTLSRMMKEQFSSNEMLAKIKIYKAKDFENNLNILYLTEKPLSDDMTSFCNGALNLLYVPQLDFSNVKKIDNTLYLINPLVYTHDIYELDLMNCTYYGINGIKFCNKLVLKNMRGDCTLYSTFANNKEIKIIEGLNVSSAKSTILNLWGWSTGSVKNTPSKVILSDDCVIRSANVVSDTELDPGAPCTNLDIFDAETLYGFCVHAYDWERNPNSFKKVDRVYLQNGKTSVNYYNYRFSEEAKAKLEGAYPDVDFKTMMEDKGWTY